MLRNPTLRLAVALAVALAVLFIGMGPHVTQAEAAGRGFFSAHSAMAETAQATQPHGRSFAISGAPGPHSAACPGLLHSMSVRDQSGCSSLTPGSFAIPLRI